MVAPVLVWRGSIDGGGFQNSGALFNAAVHGVRCAISGADVAGFHRLEGASVAGDGIWWPANAGLSKQDHNNTQSIHPSSSVSGLVFAMTGRGNGDLLRSTDHGKTWAIAGGINVTGNGETAGTGAYRRTGRMFADSGAYVWAAGFTGASTDAGASIARSTDNGATFAAWGLTGRQFRSIVVDPQDGTILYGAQETGTSPGLIKMSNCKAAGGVAPTVTQLTGAGAAQGTGLTSLRDVVAVVEGTKTWVYFITHVGAVSGIWKFNATDGTGLVDITGTLSTASLWTTLDCVRNVGNTATTVWAGCWQARTNVGSNQAEAVVKSANGGTTWAVDVTWAGTSFNLPTGQPWWRSAQPGQKTWVISGNTFDANCIRIEPGQPSVVLVFGRAGVWRTVDNGATWFPLMEDLLVSMSHGVVSHVSNPAQVANLNVDWGCLTSLNKFQDVVTEYSPNNAFGGVWTERGLVVGFGSRSDNIGPFLAASPGVPGRAGTQGSIKSTTTASSGPAATWVDQGWAAAHPTAADPTADIPRCLGLAEGLDGSGDRVLIAVAQGQKPGTAEIDRGGIYRKVIPAGQANGGTWSLVGGPIAFNGWGVNNTLEAHLDWVEGTSVIYAYDRQTGLWRSTNYGAAGSWVRISTLTATATWSGFHTVADTGGAPPPPPPPGKVPKGKVGWVDDGAYAGSQNTSGVWGTSTLRLPPTWAIQTAGMRECVLNVGLRELVNVSAAGTTYIPGSLESRIQAAVDWNVSNPEKLRVSVRLHVGIRAPDYWRTVCGQVTVTDSNFGKLGPVPRWWNAGDYRPLYSAALAALGPVVDGLDIITSVNAPGAAYFYPEPLLRFPGSIVTGTTTNGDNLIAAGYTEAADRAFNLWFPSASAVFRNTVVEVALNPAPFVSTTGGSTAVDGAHLQAVGDALIAAMPAGHACVANYSARQDYTTGTGSYETMYAWMATKAGVAWVGVQMARPHEVAQTDPDTQEMWDDVASWAAGLGFHFVETTGPIASRPATAPGGGTANIWPSAYVDNAALMLSIGATLAANPRPTVA